jgi:type IX secretion system PorP/SprF family membrane protein
MKFGGLLTIMVLTWNVSISWAQQDAHYSQYMFNGLLINPAMAGSKDAISGSVFSRRQWIGMNGAPDYQSVSVHAPFSYNRIGAGMIILRESIFSEDFLTLGFCGSYKINLRQGWLSFGMQGGFKQYRFNPDNLEVKDGNDKVLLDKSGSLNPDFGAGVYYQKKKYYIGISAQHLIPSASTSIFRMRMHGYLTGAYKITLTDKVNLIPSAMVKAVTGISPQLDLTCHLKFKESFWGGISWRSSDAAAIQAGLSLESIFPRLHQSMKLGYAYDFNITKISKVLGDSHEIMLIWDLRIPEKLSKIKNRVPSVSPLFF